MSAPAAPPATGKLAPAAPPATGKLELEVPEGAVAGDRLQFHTIAGQFSLTVPAGATPGKKMMVTMPVPSTFTPDQRLKVSALKINGTPVLPKPSAEKLELAKLNKPWIEAHWGLFPPQQRLELKVHFELYEYLPSTEAMIQSQWGMWQVPRTMCQVDKARAWEPDRWVQMQRCEFQFAGVTWEMLLEGRAVPWVVNQVAVSASAEAEKSTAHDVELCIVLKRGAQPADALPARSAPLTIWALLQFADRWSTWLRISLVPGESYEFDLGDRRSIADLGPWLESAVPTTLMLTGEKQPARGLMPGQHACACPTRSV
eukprot:CAMPEP_0183338252 /NCGR_PEP_ID=MMETSP0164_2-20130417/5612_1 /TAXON_ID=221442 /ORGANISM="Coccolithus pelagicus ssp braarudi, Strain PLY182g" /LENGTH=314 /DNA_ID=CAMNT_0025508071 /DNA_START=6 /DNA_END=950 /DNA_ORIENTATION=-